VRVLFYCLNRKGAPPPVASDRSRTLSPYCNIKEHGTKFKSWPAQWSFRSWITAQAFSHLLAVVKY